MKKPTPAILTRQQAEEEQAALLQAFDIGDTVIRPDVHRFRKGVVEELFPPDDTEPKAWALVRWLRGGCVTIALEALEKLPSRQEGGAGAVTPASCNRSPTGV